MSIKKHRQDMNKSFQRIIIESINDKLLGEHTKTVQSILTIGHNPKFKEKLFHPFPWQFVDRLIFAIENIHFKRAYEELDNSQMVMLQTSNV